MEKVGHKRRKDDAQCTGDSSDEHGFATGTGGKGSSVQISDVRTSVMSGINHLFDSLESEHTATKSELEDTKNKLIQSQLINTKICDDSRKCEETAAEFRVLIKRRESEIEDLRGINAKLQKKIEGCEAKQKDSEKVISNVRSQFFDCITQDITGSSFLTTNGQVICCILVLRFDRG